MKVLEVKNLTKNFGGLAAVSNVSLEINKNELVGLIGPNGAGKTTLFNLLTGVYNPSLGSIILNLNDKKVELNNTKPYKVTNLGIGRTFQNIRLFKQMSVLDNIKLAMNKSTKYSLIDAIFRLPAYYKEENRIQEEALYLLDVVDLKDKRDTQAKNLSYGQQRRLEIARALATGCKILFLDEPAAGMNPQETKDLTDLIYEIKEKFDLTIILIEHDMSLVMKICEKIFVLDYGKLIAAGTPEEIKTNKRVIEAYLGED